MITAITFDTLKFMERLKKSGIPETQAKAIAKAFAHAQIDAKLATQTDLKSTDLKSLEYRLIIKFGAMLALASGLIVTLGKIL